MTRGALIFAFDNEETDYVEMGAWCADRVCKHLNIPTAIVTNNPGKARSLGFEKIIEAPHQTGGTRFFEDYNSTVTWYNAGRVDAYRLTPWDETLVLDADFVVNSDNLNLLWGNSDFMCFKTAFDLGTARFLNELNQFGAHGLPMWWATVMMFRKSNTAQYIFDCMHMVHENWQHYRDLYGIQKSTYRNDFALSIALGIVSGHTGTVDEIPWPMASVLPNTKLTRTETDGYTIEYPDKLSKPRIMTFAGLDFHAMGKRDLGEIIETDRRTGLFDSGTKQQN